MRDRAGFAWGKIYSNIKPSSLTVVLLYGAWGGTRTLNPLRAQDFKSCAYTSSATQAFFVEVPAGIEPAHRGFADPSVSTSPRHRIIRSRTSFLKVPSVDGISKNFLSSWPHFSYYTLRILTVSRDDNLLLISPILNYVF